MILDLPGPFADDADTPVAATDVNALIRAALLVDGLSYRTVPAFDSAATMETGTPGFYPGITFRCWAGGLEYRTGMTTLTMTGILDKRGSASMEFYVNGVLKDTHSTNGTFTKTITLSGYTIGQALDIEARVINLPSATDGTYLITDCYTNVPAPATAWPGKPTFGTTYPSTLFVQLVRGVQHCADRINAIPRPLQVAHRWVFGGLGKVESRPLYTGYVTKHVANHVLRVGGIAHIKNAGEKLQVFIDGNPTVAWESAVWTPGSYNFYPAISLSGAVGTRYRIDIWANCVTSALKETWGESRYCFDVLRAEADPASPYPAATPPALLNPLGSYTQADLTSRLNQIATIVEATKLRLDSTAMWNRFPAMRRRYGYRDDQDALIQRYPPRQMRLGDRLVVAGRAVKIGWGPLVLESPLTRDYKYEPTYSQTAVDGDAVSTNVLYFDACKGLTVGQPYYLLGDVRYAAEDSLVD